MNTPVAFYCENGELTKALEFILSKISDSEYNFRLKRITTLTPEEIPSPPPIFIFNQKHKIIFNEKSMLFSALKTKPCLIFIESNPQPAAEFALHHHLPWSVLPFEIEDVSSLSLVIRNYIARQYDVNFFKNIQSSYATEETYDYNFLLDALVELRQSSEKERTLGELILANKQFSFWAVGEAGIKGKKPYVELSFPRGERETAENDNRKIELETLLLTKFAEEADEKTSKMGVFPYKNGLSLFYYEFDLKNSSAKQFLIAACKNKGSQDNAFFQILARSYELFIENIYHKEKLLYEKSEYSHLLDISKVGIWKDDINGKIIGCNDFIPALFGYEKEQMLGKSFASFINNKDVDMVKTLHKYRVSGKTALDHYPVDGIKKDGSTIHLDVAVISRYKDGKIAGTSAFIWDITENIKTQAALLRREKILDAVRYTAESLLDQGFPEKNFSLILERLGKSADVHSVMLYSLKKENNEVSAHRLSQWYAKRRMGEADKIQSEMEKIDFTAMGFSRWPNLFAQAKSIFGNTVLLPPAEKQKFESLGIRSFIASPIMVSSECWGFLLLITSEKEERIWSEGEVASIKAAAGVIAAGIQREVIQENLLDSEQRYRLVAETLPDGIFIISEQKILWANNRGVELLGAKYLSEIFDQSIINFISPSDMTRFKKFLKNLMPDDETIKKLLININRLDGEKIDIEVTTRMNKILGNNAILAIVRDITQQKKAESEQLRLAQVVEQATESIVITDLQGKIQYVNPCFEKISGYTQKELLGKSTSILKSGQHEDSFYKELWQTVLKGKFWRGVFINKAKDGTIFYEHAVIFPIKTKRGKTVNFAAVKRDITRERLLEIRVNRTERLEAVGKLAGGISHDFNNIITAIYGFISIAKEHRDDPQSITEAIGGVERSAQRAAGLVRQLLAFSRRQLIQPEIIQPNKLISDFSNMLERLIGEDINLVMDLTPDVRNIFADSGQIEQVLMNLVVNARDALQSLEKIQEEKMINIVTRNYFVKEKMFIESFEINPGHYVELKVTDNGVGMNEEIKSHIFEPFFTTKSIDSGTGLGLATVYGVVKQNNGFITVQSKPEEGSQFSILWPAHLTEKELTIFKTPSDMVTRGGSERILFVEDDLQIREFAEIFLRKLGYDVILAGDGKEALQKYNRLKKPVNLLLTDLVMPRMGGKELAEEITSRDAKVKVIFSSGYLNKLFREEDRLTKMNTISKPYKIHDLAQLIRKVLDKEEN